MRFLSQSNIKGWDKRSIRHFLIHLGPMDKNLEMILYVIV